MKKMIIIMALFTISGCSGIPVIDDPIIQQTGIDADTASIMEEIADFILMWFPWNLLR